MDISLDKVKEIVKGAFEKTEETPVRKFSRVEVRKGLRAMRKKGDLNRSKHHKMQTRDGMNGVSRSAIGKVVKEAMKQGQAN